ncbi:MAG: cobyrinate a,c-diamide synthase [Selenomonadaceae bacterium]|nr:cobyrinate a,c-diamide synthase [Selenomonadaceae bacterium]
MKKIPRIIIAATQSGSGKTTITCGILAALKSRGVDVQAFKVGPDYIDTGYHEIASGRPAHNLDSWLVGREMLGWIFFNALKSPTIAVIEGVMGLYDGGAAGVSSTAEIAKILRAPVVLVIDAKSMGASAAAVALGFREFDKDLNLAGVILNRIGSDSHARMIVDALDKIGVKCFGAVRRNAEFALPERHLGLVPTAENNFTATLEKISATVSEQVNLDALLELANAAPPLDFKVSAAEKVPVTCRIAVARDAAFNFCYGESLRVLENFGAEIIFFSPLEDETLPDADGLIIGGGFPEMFAAELERNKKIRTDIRLAAENGLPVFAECGGFMYLMNSIADFSGKIFEMCGVIPARAAMTDRLQMVGYVDAEILRDCVIGRAGDKLHAHEFHFSIAQDSAGENIFDCTRLRTGRNYRAGFAEKNIAASYLHIHFAGCTNAARNFVNACSNFKRKRSAF